MDEESNFEAAVAIARQALAQMEAHRTPPNPRAFELFYTYIAGVKAELNQAMSDLVMRNKRIGSAEVDRLYEEFLPQSPAAGQVMQVGERLGAQIGQVLKMLESVGTSTRAYNASLAAADSGLAGAPEAVDVATIVADLLEATRRMARSNRQLEENLSRSNHQIAELARSLRVAHAQSATDPLTGLANRRRFDGALGDALAEARRTGSPLSLLMIDIDDFKRLNDRYGHQVGDAALKFLAQTLRAKTKGQDLAARYGGEEFAVILPNTPVLAAVALAEQVRQAVSARELKRKSTGESMGRITVSVGVAASEPRETARAFVQRADGYLYAAKRSGRNRVVSELDPEPRRAAG